MYYTKDKHLLHFYIDLIFLDILFSAYVVLNIFRQDCKETPLCCIRFSVDNVHIYLNCVLFVSKNEVIGEPPENGYFGVS